MWLLLNDDKERSSMIQNPPFVVLPPLGFFPERLVRSFHLNSICSKAMSIYTALPNSDRSSSGMNYSIISNYAKAGRHFERCEKGAERESHMCFHMLTKMG